MQCEWRVEMLSFIKIGSGPGRVSIGEDNKVGVKTIHIPDHKPLSFRHLLRPSQNLHTCSAKAALS